jgi:hypothetical protein
MRFCLWLAVAASLFVTLSASAQTLTVLSPPPELRIVGRNGGKTSADYALQLNDLLRLELSGSVAALARGEWQKPISTRKIVLLLDGVTLDGLTAALVDPRHDGKLELDFQLTRDSNDGQSRAAWNTLFERQHSYATSLPVSLELGNNVPIGAVEPEAIPFQVAPPSVIWGVSAVGLVLFVLGFWGLTRWKRILCDDGAPTYSLGKAQLAFWGLLVFLSVVAVFVITRSLEHIPAQTLILLGISGATGLGSVMINKTKQADDQEQMKKLAVEEGTLKDDGTKAGQVLASAIQSKVATLANPEASRGFFWDICSDGRGPSFHRLQVVAWTVLLGVVFVRSVGTVLSLPEFPDSLLLLMGISNGTYLTLKVSE